jgi:acetyl esterase/lipase
LPSEPLAARAVLGQDAPAKASAKTPAQAQAPAKAQAPAQTGAPANPTAVSAIERVLPPAGMPLAPAVREELVSATRTLRGRLANVGSHKLLADIEVYVKALELALEFGEFYAAKDVDKARFAIAEAERRLAAVTAEAAAAAEKPVDWPRNTGLTVRGFRSRLDGSAQPYGVVAGTGHDFAKPAPLYVWLHGRGDKQTDLHFIHERHHSQGQIAPPGALVIHPFGRHCLGFKSAGEIDVLEAVEHACSQYAIDPDRIVLIGFSMGGAGAWHLGAHYVDRWCAVSPGAGFAETARYNKLSPDKYPPVYEQQLWGCYDVPAYVRNLFNVPVIAYSGEKDRQIQAAQVMEEAFKAEGRELRHLIGPGVEHRYEPATLKKLLDELSAIVRRGREKSPQTVTLQTRTLRYSRVHWVEALGLERHWNDSRVDAAIGDDRSLALQTSGVTALRVWPPADIARIVVNGSAATGAFAPRATSDSIRLSRDSSGQWQAAVEKTADGNAVGEKAPASREPSAFPGPKRPGVQGPIDDAFLAPFVFVAPSGPCASPAVDRWVRAELAHAAERWRAVCRGTVEIKLDRELTDADVSDKNLILWGDSAGNAVIRAIADRLPIIGTDATASTGRTLVKGGKRWDAAHHVPAFIYPNPRNPNRYVVLNSGLTFREAHDRTNSQQNPKLPDWVVFDIREPATAQSAARVAAAGFFDEQWQ